MIPPDDKFQLIQTHNHINDQRVGRSDKRLEKILQGKGNRQSHQFAAEGFLSGDRGFIHRISSFP